MLHFVELEAIDAVTILKLNRPPVNALDESALDELSQAVHQVEDDPTVGAVVLASAIPGIFCAGGDLKYWPHHYPDQGRAISAIGRKIFAQIEALTKPSIAAIEGRVIGDGLSLALACDIRLAAQGTTFHLPEISYGFIPGWGTVSRLVQSVGLTSAAELLLVGEPLDAVRARSIGLVNRLVTPHDLMPAALALAATMAARPRLALRYAKAVLRGDASHLSNREAWEASCFEQVWDSQEWKQGLQALGLELSGEA